MPIKMQVAALVAAATGSLCVSMPASALNIVLNPDASFLSQPDGGAALLGFQKAANYWNSVLTNDATINIDIFFRNLGNPNVIGQAGSNALTVSVVDVYAGLANVAATPLDTIAVNNLVKLTPAGGIGYRMPDSVTGVAGAGSGLGVETVSRGSVFDNDDTWNNLYMAPNTANAKVLGLAFDPVADSYWGVDVDAEITFNSTFAFDYDPSDGVGIGRQDFVSVALHEIGHALGFVSGTDIYDYYGSPNGPCDTPSAACGGFNGNSFDWDGTGSDVLSVLDLFRYSTNPPASAGWDPATGKRYLQLDPNRGAGFSIDGEDFFNQPNTTGNQFTNYSTGRYNGDGQQASHFKDSNGFFDRFGCFITNEQVGIMDPTSGSCQPGLVTGNDLAAFDAIGYNLNMDILRSPGYRLSTAAIFAAPFVPEPGTWAMMIGGFALVGGSMRRRATKVSFA